VGLLLATSLPTQASKDFYKWKDENGVTHYSEHPPSKKTAKGDATKIRTTNLKYDAPASDAPTKDNKEESKQEGIPPITQEKSAELCEIAKKNLKVIAENARIRIKEGEKDEYRFLTQEEIEQRKKSAEKQRDEHC
jgi:hypothetical protein